MFKKGVAPALIGVSGERRPTPGTNIHIPIFFFFQELMIKPAESVLAEKVHLIGHCCFANARLKAVNRLTYDHHHSQLLVPSSA